MPVIPNNPNLRAKYDAYKLLSEMKLEPLRRAIECAERITDPIEQFHAWIKVCEFVHTKPKAPVEITGSVTLEQILAGSWDGSEASKSSIPGLQTPGQA